MFKPVLAVLFFANLAFALFNGLPFERPVRKPVKIADFNQFINDFNKRVDNENINHATVLKKGININDLKIDLDGSAASTTSVSTSTSDIEKRDVSLSPTTASLHSTTSTRTASSIIISLPSVDSALSSQISASVSSMLEKMSEKYKSAAATYTSVTRPAFTRAYN